MFSILRVVVTRTLIALNAGRPPPSKEPRRPALVVLGTHQQLLITLERGGYPSGCRRGGGRSRPAGALGVAPPLLMPGS